MKFENLQYLRAIAVIGAHTFWGTGAQGVDVFFVISGFIMFFVMDSRNKGAARFFSDRYITFSRQYTWP